jgi:hypothetical protein
MLLRSVNVLLCLRTDKQAVKTATLLLNLWRGAEAQDDSGIIAAAPSTVLYKTAVWGPNWIKEGNANIRSICFLPSFHGNALMSNCSKLPSTRHSRRTL